MLNYIQITNFGSIGKDTQKVSFVSKPDNAPDETVRKYNSEYVNLVNAIVGHNGSGKTKIGQALSFAFWLIGKSYTSMAIGEALPVDSHRLYKDAPTEIELEFFDSLQSDAVFRYKVSLTKKAILEEKLDKRHKNSPYENLFHYSRSEGKNWDFTSNIGKEINKNDLERFEKRENVAVLSSLIETGYLEELAFVKHFHSNVNYIGYGGFGDAITAALAVSRSLRKHEDLCKSALEFLKGIDIAVSDFSFGEAGFSITASAGKMYSAGEDKFPILEFIHKVKGKEFELPLFAESSGTIVGLDLFADIFSILEKGGVIFVDEIEAGLHPYTVRKLIYFFENKEENPLGAQLIFTTHQAILLKDRLKSQIFITEKPSETLETEIFRLDEVAGVADTDDFTEDYLAGAYGGVGDIKLVKKA